jgi:hypothetical protein
MHVLLIFFPTLGAYALFGVLVFRVGPILAALYTPVWLIFRAAIRAAPRDEVA